MAFRILEANRRFGRFASMLVFMDFEASSLGKRSFPIEVAWVFEDGRSKSFLIKPAPGWTEWDQEAEAVHKISQAILASHGVPHDEVAHRMIDELIGHDLLASAPSWDGKWLSTLLRAAGLPRHSLRLRDSDVAHRECATAILEPLLPPAALAATIDDLLASAEPRAPGEPPAHRALADAIEERERWLAVREAARAVADVGLRGR